MPHAFENPFLPGGHGMHSCILEVPRMSTQKFESLSSSVFFTFDNNRSN